MHSNKIAAALSRKQEGRFPTLNHVGTAALSCPAGQSPAGHRDTIPPSIPTCRKDATNGAPSESRPNQYCPYLPRTESSSFWES